MPNKRNQTRAPGAPKKKPGKKRAVRGPRNKTQLSSSVRSILTDRSRYLIATKNPFHPEALGVKGPDEWRNAGTDTFCIRIRMPLTSNSTGNGAWIFYPNPLLSCTQFSDANGIANYCPWSLAHGSTAITFGAAIDTQLQSEYVQYRVIAGGIRLRNALSFNNVTGDVIVGSMPTCEHEVTQDVLTAMNAGATGGMLSQQAVGMNATQLQGGFMNLPTVKTVALDSLISENLYMSFKPTGGDAFKWRNCSNNTQLGNGYTLLTSAIASTATGLVTGESRCDSCTSDSTAFMVNVIGAPVSTTIMYMDMIYHCEGLETPVSNSTTTAITYTANKADGTLTESIAGKISRSLADIAIAAPDMIMQVRDTLKGHRGFLQNVARLALL